MRIGVDAMGGDYAPGAVVEGVVATQSWRSADQQIVLYGHRDKLLLEFSRLGHDAQDYEIVHCEDVITMSDHPVRAISKKPHSSISIGFQDLASGVIDGFASAGNTGAMMAGTMTYLKVIDGLLRPAIAAFIPAGEDQNNLLLDVGLNSDCKAEVLVQYGWLGSLYARFVMGIENPRVGLINIGEEPEKGNLISKQAHEMMRNNPDIVFGGNIEGNQLFTNARADVFVCDGFVGNILLKQAEAFFMMARKRNIHDSFFEKFNFEHYGGTPVLGVNAPVVVGHGISNGTAINNMIRRTSEVIAAGLCDKFKSFFSNG